MAKYLIIYVCDNWFCYIFVLQNKMGSLFNQSNSERVILKMAEIDWCARHKWWRLWSNIYFILYAVSWVGPLAGYQATEPKETPLCLPDQRVGSQVQQAAVICWKTRRRMKSGLHYPDTRLSWQWAVYLEWSNIIVIVPYVFKLNVTVRRLSRRKFNSAVCHGMSYLGSSVVKALSPWVCWGDSSFFFCPL